MADKKLERKAIEYILGRKVGDFHREANKYAYKYPTGKKWYTMKAEKVDDAIKHHEKALLMEGGGRIDRLVSSWKEEGYAISHINNDDTEFFKRIGIDSDKVGTTSRLGTDVIYYDTERPSIFNKDSYKNGGSVEDENPFTYMMLSRLQSDNDYFLGAGGRNENNLWAGSVDAQIDEMKRLWESLPEDGKPEWLSMEEILKYEKEMKKDKKYKGGGEIKVGDKVNLKEIRLPNGDIQFERVEDGEVAYIKDGIYGVRNYKTMRTHQVRLDQIEGYQGGGEIDKDRIAYYTKQLEKVKSAYPTNTDSNHVNTRNQEYVSHAEKQLELVKKGKSPFYEKDGSNYKDGGEIKKGDTVKYKGKKAEYTATVLSVDGDKNMRSAKIKWNDNGKTESAYLMDLSKVRVSTYAQGGQTNGWFKGALSFLNW